MGPRTQYPNRASNNRRRDPTPATRGRPDAAASGHTTDPGAEPPASHAHHGAKRGSAAQARQAKARTGGARGHTGTQGPRLKPSQGTGVRLAGGTAGKSPVQVPLEAPGAATRPKVDAMHPIPRARAAARVRHPRRRPGHAAAPTHHCHPRPAARGGEGGHCPTQKRSSAAGRGPQETHRPKASPKSPATSTAPANTKRASASSKWTKASTKVHGTPSRATTDPRAEAVGALVGGRRPAPEVRELVPRTAPKPRPRPDVSTSSAGAVVQSQVRKTAGKSAPRRATSLER